jgi:hypothetical protein
MVISRFIHWLLETTHSQRAFSHNAKSVSSLSSGSIRAMLVGVERLSVGSGLREHVS